MAAAAYHNANRSPPNATNILTNVFATGGGVGTVNCAAIFGKTYAEALHEVSRQWHNPDNHLRMDGHGQGWHQDKPYQHNNQSGLWSTFMGRNRLRYKQQSADGDGNATIKTQKNIHRGQSITAAINTKQTQQPTG